MKKRMEAELPVIQMVKKLRTSAWFPNIQAREYVTQILWNRSETDATLIA